MHAEIPYRAPGPAGWRFAAVYLIFNEGCAIVLRRFDARAHEMGLFAISSE